MVDETRGVTRDRREGDGRIADLEFRLIDNAGLEDAFDDSLEARMRRQTEKAVEEADLVLMPIDARAGVAPLDAHFPDWLRRGPTTVVLAPHPAEGRGGPSGRRQGIPLRHRAPRP